MVGVSEEPSGSTEKKTGRRNQRQVEGQWHPSDNLGLWLEVTHPGGKVLCDIGRDEIHGALKWGLSF